MCILSLHSLFCIIYYFCQQFFHFIYLSKDQLLNLLLIQSLLSRFPLSFLSPTFLWSCLFLLNFLVGCQPHLFHFFLPVHSPGLICKALPNTWAGGGGVSICWPLPGGGVWAGDAWCSHGGCFWPLASPDHGPSWDVIPVLGQIAATCGPSNRRRKLLGAGGIFRSLTQNSSQEQVTHCCLLSPLVWPSQWKGQRRCHLFLFPLDAVSDGTGHVRMAISLT